MKNTVLLITILLLSINSWAAEEPANPLPLDPKFMGVHSMVLMNNGRSMLASHMPSYDLPHHVQILYSVTVPHSALRYLVRDADLVTIRLKPFNLQKLMRGDRLTLSADIFTGDVKRGGSLIFEDIDITFKERLYLRMLDELEAPSKIQKYDTVLLKDNQRIAIHQIQAPPSYDHLVLLYDDINCITQFHTRSATPSQDVLNQKLSFCGSMKSLYYETDGFNK